MEIANKKIHPSVLLYLLSMVFPIFINAWTLLGFMGLLIGWIGLLGGDLLIGLPWSSNLFYLISLFGKKLNLKIRIAFSTIATTFGLVALGIREIPENEGGGNTEVYVGIGFTLWIASYTYLLVDQLKELRNKSIGG
ncbi:hypothetical protein LRR18_11505 [Mangrovimonas sp. AS39]|uniref:hypothetical protein n=1 Tax=Mangrovimonas futianensis TaxID=2895523 RepID=UPI001E32D664|nr:hypothetical protein [Mangrovimonas futianensis]MCF1192212.1 hypothetical protein [Mangrovimonas futianensis]MCF1196039.1 hypothetical protein [Mangrovimonas futianensis]